MLYTVKNNSQNPRIIFAAGRKATSVPVGGEVVVELEPHEAANAVTPSVVVTDADGNTVEAQVYEKQAPGWRPAEVVAAGELIQLPTVDAGTGEIVPPASPLDHDHDGNPGGSVDELDQMKVADLKALAKAENVDLQDATRKDDIIAAIRLDREAKAAE